MKGLTHKRHLYSKAVFELIGKFRILSLAAKIRHGIFFDMNLNGFKKMRKTFIIAIAAAALMCAYDPGYAGEYDSVNVAVFYYPWYGTEENDGRVIHWDEGYLRGKLDPDSAGAKQLPVLGEYSCKDPWIVRQHMAWSERYGINTWICSWRGAVPGHPGIDMWPAEALEDCIMPELPGRAVNFCIFYESADLLGLDRETSKIFFDGSKKRIFVEDFEYMADRYFNHPNYLKIDGKPVVFIYLTSSFAGDYRGALQAIREAVRVKGYDLYLVGDEIYWTAPDLNRISAFDAITAYNMHSNEAINDGYPDDTGFCTRVAVKAREYKDAVDSLNSSTGIHVDFIPNIFGGFNDQSSGVKDVCIIPRQMNPGASCTSTFETMCDIAKSLLSQKNRTITITSWNGWHKDTQIEPAALSGPVNTPYNCTAGGPGGKYNYYYNGYGEDYLRLIAEKFGSISIELNESGWQINGIKPGGKASNLNNFGLPIHNIRNTGGVSVIIDMGYAPSPYAQIKPGFLQGLDTFITAVKEAVIPPAGKIKFAEVAPGETVSISLTYGAPTGFLKPIGGMNAVYDIRAYKKTD